MFVKSSVCYSYFLDYQNLQMTRFLMVFTFSLEEIDFFSSLQAISLVVFGSLDGLLRYLLSVSFLPHQHPLREMNSLLSLDALKSIFR